MTDGCVFPTLDECVSAALGEPELVAQWNRLNTESPIRVPAFEHRSAIARMVDEACHVPPVVWSPETRDRFVRFIGCHVWRPICNDGKAKP